MQSIRNKRFYPYLIPKYNGDKLALMTHVQGHDTNKMLFISYSVQGLRLFTVFEDYLKFARFQSSIKPEYWCFFELIHGDRAQKPKFDLDLSLSSGDVLCTSPLSDDTQKFSSHDITIDNMIDKLHTEIPCNDLEAQSTSESSEDTFSVSSMEASCTSKSSEDVQNVVDEIIDRNFVRETKFTKEEEIRLVNEWDLVVENLIDNIIIVLRELNVEINLEEQVLVYNSHGEKKRSTHLVLDGLCHNNNVEAGQFYELVTMKMDPLYRRVVDNAVYSTKQQFRVIGSQKQGSLRPKRLQMEIPYHGNIIKHVYPFKITTHQEIYTTELYQSFITCTSSCQYLSLGTLPEILPKNRSVKVYDIPDANETDIELCLQMMSKMFGLDYRDRRFPFKYLGVTGTIILLKRLRPTRCTLCNRIHENENPFIQINNTTRVVYFDCRRAGGKKQPIGHLPLSPESMLSGGNERRGVHSDSSSDEEEFINFEVAKQDARYETPVFLQDLKNKDTLRSLAFKPLCKDKHNFASEPSIQDIKLFTANLDTSSWYIGLDRK
ncbi:hypothetical protein D3C87_974570 [compost metagenome]